MLRQFLSDGPCIWPGVRNRPAPRAPSAFQRVRGRKGPAGERGYQEMAQPALAWWPTQMAQPVRSAWTGRTASCSRKCAAACCVGSLRFKTEDARGRPAAVPTQAPCPKGNTVPAFSPEQLLMRLASLIPAPGTPMRTCLGVLAADSKLMTRVVPKPTSRRGTRHRCTNACGG